MTEYLQESGGGLLWGSLLEGRLVKRYKRFLADVRLEDGCVVTAHSPNTGSMMGCSEPGRTVYLSRHDDPRRKLKYTWEIIDMPDSRVGINTAVPNRLVRAAAMNGGIAELRGYGQIRSEVKTGEHTRLDLALSEPGRPVCYVEIKNCTLVEDGAAMFPDAVTERGRKHLNELEQLVQRGERGVIFFLVQRMDATVFRPADRIDPEYGLALRRAARAGVEPLAYDVSLDMNGIWINQRLPVDI